MGKGKYYSRLIFILLFPMFSFAQIQRITTDTTIYGVWDLQGKVLNISAKISGSVTIRNAIIEANPYIQIFDTSVNLINCRTERFSSKWYGNNIQKSAFTCIANNIYDLHIVESTTFSEPIKLFNLYNGQYVGFSLHIKGNGNMWSDRTKLTYTGTGYAIGLQYAKGVIIEGINIVGTYAAPNTTGVAYYTTPFPQQNLSGIVVDYDGSKNTGGSTYVTIKDTWVTNFDVCYDISPNGVTFNADVITLENIRVGNCRVGIRSGQAQEKGNEIRNVVAWDRTEILLQIGRSGKFQGGDYILRGGNIAGQVVQLFDIQLGGWNKFTCYGLYAESIARIGFLGSNTSQHKVPISLDGMSIRFNINIGSQTLITSQAQRLKISNSNLWYYGEVGRALVFNGHVNFENCDFGASNFTNGLVNNFDYLNGQIIIKRTN